MNTNEIQNSKLTAIVRSIIRKKTGNLTTRVKTEQEMKEEILRIIKDEVKLKY